jgi:hypothetical protein
MISISNIYVLGQISEHTTQRRNMSLHIYRHMMIEVKVKTVIVKRWHRSVLITLNYFLRIRTCGFIIVKLYISIIFTILILKTLDFVNRRLFKALGCYHSMQDIHLIIPSFTLPQHRYSMRQSSPTTLF